MPRRQAFQWMESLNISHILKVVVHLAATAHAKDPLLTSLRPSQLPPASSSFSSRWSLEPFYLAIADKDKTQQLDAVLFQLQSYFCRHLWAFWFSERSYVQQSGATSSLVFRINHLRKLVNRPLCTLLSTINL